MNKYSRKSAGASSPIADERTEAQRGGVTCTPTFPLFPARLSPEGRLPDFTQIQPVSSSRPSVGWEWGSEDTVGPLSKGGMAKNLYVGFTLSPLLHHVVLETCSVPTPLPLSSPS